MRGGNSFLSLNTPRNRSRSSSRAADSNKYWKKYFFSIKTFLFFLTCFQLVNLLALTYTDSVLNYISKRFRIPYSMASFIPSSYMIGSVVAAIPVSYFGAKWNKPRTISFGVMIMIFGLGLCILPHFIMKPYSVSNFTAGELCHRKTVKINAFGNYSMEFIQPSKTASQDELQSSSTALKLKKIWHRAAERYHSPNNMFKMSLSTPVDLPCNKNATMYNPSILLIIGHTLIGIGASPLWPLGIAYLDDHVVARKMPVYLGIFIGTTLTGPVGGFLLGSVSSVIYVSLTAHQITPKDPRWIGAWWLGYVIAAGLLFLLLIPFCFFPKSLPKSDEKRAENLQKLMERVGNKQESRLEKELNYVDSGDEGTCSSQYSESSCLLEEKMPSNRIKRTITDLYKATMDILSKPVAIGCILAYVALASLLTGVTTFGSTYVQREFNVLRLTSDMLIGGVCVPLAIITTFIGGYIVKKYNFDLQRTIFFNVILSSIGLACFFCVYPIGCDLPRISGINERITNARCSEVCNCPKNVIKLVCGSDGISYISPCYAGCTNETTTLLHLNKIYTYHNCKCVNSTTPTAKLGPCAVKYCTMKLFLFMLVCATAISALCFCQAPGYSILLRVLKNSNKSYGIGIMTVVSRLLGFIPAPIWFARLVDKSCIFWGPKCHARSLCKLYNNSGLRLNYISGCIVCASTYTFIYFLTYLYVRYRNKNKSQTAP